MKDKLADALFASLTNEYPAPWRLVYDEKYPECVIAINAADGSNHITMETHSGDGDSFNLQAMGAIALTDFVNGMYEQIFAP